jgi:hypothetical protein
MKLVNAQKGHYDIREASFHFLIPLLDGQKLFSFHFVLDHPFKYVNC